ncbi:hypothetical protein VCHA53O466_50479 [Vibrio chagasii]|nr:hypothetical protein VCHA53O466_50479 [Vibrio chagasii]
MEVTVTVSSTPLNIKRRKSRKQQDKVSERIITEESVLESAIDGANFKPDTGVQRKSRTVSFDLHGNRLIDKLNSELGVGNTIVCRAALKHLETLSQIEVIQLSDKIPVKKGAAARKGLSPLEFKELLGYPANRTLGAVMEDNLRLDKMRNEYKFDFARTYRIALEAFGALSKAERHEIVNSTFKSKRGAPRRTI